MQHNAKENVEIVSDKLVECMENLTDALITVENEVNRQRIVHTKNAIDGAIEKANHALANFKE